MQDHRPQKKNDLKHLVRSIHRKNRLSRGLEDTRKQKDKKTKGQKERRKQQA